MTKALEDVLRDHGYELHGRIRGGSGRCWVIGSKRTNWDGGDKEARVFAGIADERAPNAEVYFRFSVSRSALVSESVRRLTGDPETFLREAGLMQFRRLLQSDDKVDGEYPEQMLHSHSTPEEFVMEDPDFLDAEIARVRSSIFELLRNNAYNGKKRTSKAEIIAAVCTTDAILDRTLRTLEHRKHIDGALGGQIKITPEGEAEYENSRANNQGAAPAYRASRQSTETNSYDVFISHASEDKDAFVRPLAEALIRAGLKVWYDESTLKPGDSLRESIDRGLVSSRFGVVVLSHRFFEKQWPQKELNALFSLMKPGEKKLLPIWHEITREELAKYSPMVVDVVAIRSDEGIDTVVKKILEVVRPAR